MMPTFLKVLLVLSAYLVQDVVVGQTTTTPAPPQLTFVGSMTSNQTVKSFYILQTFYTWPQSKTYCQSKGLNLATIDSSEEHQAVINWAAAQPAGLYVPRRSVWLAGNSSSSNIWTWVDSGKPVPIPGKTSGFSKWFPNRDVRPLECLRFQMNEDPNLYGGWFSDTCLNVVTNYPLCSSVVPVSVPTTTTTTAATTTTTTTSTTTPAPTTTTTTSTTAAPTTTKSTTTPATTTTTTTTTRPTTTSTPITTTTTKPTTTTTRTTTTTTTARPNLNELTKLNNVLRNILKYCAQGKPMPLALCQAYDSIRNSIMLLPEPVYRTQEEADISKAEQCLATSPKEVPMCGS